MKNEKEEIERLPDEQRRIIDLQLGKVEPKDEKEKAMLKEMRDDEAKGIMIDLPWE